MRKEQVFWGLLLAGTTLMIGGCLAAAVGAGAAGTVAYIRGDLEGLDAARIDAVYKATEKALDQLGLVITKKSSDSLSAKIIARDVQDKKITITLKATEEGPTRISIRVGIFGDQTKSMLIYNKIKENI